MLKYLNRKLFVVILLFTSPVLIGQNTNFVKPLQQGTFVWSASFAELRDWHFHGGIDYKTGGVEGVPLLAIDDGVIETISIAPTGYGKCIKLRLNNGMLVVYGHLSNLEPTLQKELTQVQYSKKSFVVTYTPTSKTRVKKGELIGYSGNSGSSGGPHLHFELRNKKGYILNPCNYGYDVPDDIKPTALSLAIYPYEIYYPLIGDLDQPCFYPIVDNKVKSDNGDTINFYGRCAFGIEAFDRANGQANKLGLYSLQLFIDDSLVFAWKLDSVNNEHAIDINAFIDYNTYAKTGNRYQWTRILPNNRLKIYGKGIKDGIYDFLEEGIRKVNFNLADYAGNTSKINFYIKTDTPERLHIIDTPDDSNLLIECNKPFVYEDTNISLSIPKNSFYQNTIFTLSNDSSQVIDILSNGVVLRNYCTFGIKPINVPSNLRSKALVVEIDENGKQNAIGGSYKNGYVFTDIRKFGKFAVAIDTVPPKITPVSINKNKSSIIKITAHDDFSGIGQYEARIDNNWFLMEWDPKNRAFTGNLNTIQLANGKHQFVFVVSDKKNNKSTYKCQIEK